MSIESLTRPGLINEGQEIKPDSKVFLELCDMLKQIHLTKAHDYGSGNDPLGNFESAKRLGLQASQGVFLRMQDKMSRLETYCLKGTLKNEALEDNLIDLAAYSLLAIVVLRRERNAYEQTAKVPHGPR